MLNCTCYVYSLKFNCFLFNLRNFKFDFNYGPWHFIYDLANLRIISNLECISNTRRRRAAVEKGMILKEVSMLPVFCLLRTNMNCQYSYFSRTEKLSSGWSSPRARGNFENKKLFTCISTTSIRNHISHLILT